MEQDRALAILKTLADGVNPATGEQFSADSPYQQPDIIRALFWAVHTLGGPVRPQKQAAPRPENTSTNAGKPWSEEEDIQLGGAFDAGKSIGQLALEHKRSRWAIEARLVKLGRLAEPPAGLRFPVRKDTAAQPTASYLTR
ncbi:MAG TPA: hypothetical protein VFR39_05820 [Burkholderiales bacterium]|nr:hypothetical protein [Burkholderiales bacterium]